MFERLGHLLFRRRRWVLALTGVFVAGALVWGSGVFGSLANGGFDDPNSESVRALDQIESSVGRTGVDVLVLYRGDTSVATDPAYRDAVQAHLGRLPKDKVLRATTFWSTRSPAFVSADRQSTYAALTLAGGTDDERLESFHQIEPLLREPATGLTIRLGGPAAIFDEVNEQTEKDIQRAEMISLPLVLVLLVLIFGGLVAASLTLVVGGLAILGAFTVLRALTEITDVSIYSINIVTMIGLGLSIDYALFVVTRFREELAAGNDVESALARTMATAGRTVAFSGLTVGIAILSLLLFPVMFLRSMAYGGAAVVAVAMIAALTALPAVLAVLGHRIDRLRIPLPRRTVTSTAHGAWYRLAHSVMRRPVLYVAVLAPLLVVLGLPFLRAEFGGVDHRALPAGAETRVVTETVERDMTNGPGPGFSGSDLVASVRFDRPVTDPAVQRELASYTQRLGQVEHIDAVRPGGTSGQIAVVTMHTPYGAQDLDARAVVKAVRAVPLPAGAEVLVGGDSAIVTDLLHTLGERLPWMALFIVVVTLVLLFMAFGSVVLPIKAVVMNALSVSASFGALVWIFQDGHLADLFGFTSTGFLEATNPVLMFAMLFGLSMDYEVFLLSRIREEYDRTGDNTAAVAAGLQNTGRIITSAALLLVVVVAAFSTSGIVFVKMIGIGLVIVILLDATIVRALLVPATMRLLGRANWWAPGPLARWWRSYGFREESATAPPEPARELDDARR